MGVEEIMDPESDFRELESVAGSEGIAAEDASPESLLQKADKRRKQRSDHLFLDIPSWDGDLIGEYSPVARKVLEAMIRKSMQEAKRSGGASTDARVRADVDIIQRACCGLWIRDDDGEDSTTLHLAGGDTVQAKQIMANGIPATFATVNQIIGKPDINSSLEIILYLFGGDKPGGDPGVPISAHAMVIARYMRDPSRDPLEGGVA